MRPFRLKDMFDVRLQRYVAEADTRRGDFWGTASQVVASFHTLRSDGRGARQRLLDADPWDLVIVDEAHHLGLDKKIGTGSGSGSMHAALAAVKEPREIERRVWSAQTAVLLPEIESTRLDIVREHRFQIADNLRRTGEGNDPDEMEIGDLVRVFGRPGFDRQVGLQLRGLRDVRNALAHCRPLSPERALDLVRHG